MALINCLRIATEKNEKFQINILKISDVIPYFEKNLKHEYLYFKIDELYTASNDSYIYELKSISDESSDF